MRHLSSENFVKIYKNMRAKFNWFYFLIFWVENSINQAELDWNKIEKAMKVWSLSELSPDEKKMQFVKTAFDFSHSNL